MKVPISWLKEYIKTDSDPTKIGEMLTALGHMQDGPVQQKAGDTVLDFEVRQNRSDCLSIIGLARELSAAFEVKLQYPSTETLLSAINDDKRVVIEDSNLCFRFNALEITNITATETPMWIAQRLQAYGIEAINPLVDITNFVMVEYGQPLHAFDKDKLQGGLVIRPAKNGEKLTVLGGRIIDLTSHDLIIADASGPVSLAGVMGGESTKVTAKTKSIVLEAATYNQASIRTTTRRHDIRSEASTRLEKFLHPHLTTVALERTSKLIIDICSGTINAHIDAYPKKIPGTVISFDPADVLRLGGIILDNNEVVKIFEKLEMTVLPKNNLLSVTVPYFRTDIEESADLVEEALRFYGYDKIPENLPESPPPMKIQSALFDFEEKVRDLMVSMGFDEQITEPLVHEINSELQPVVLENSLTEEKNMLRTTLKNNLLIGCKNRKKYRLDDLRLFEVGKIYFKEGESCREKRVLALLTSSKAIDYFDLKGVVSVLASRLDRKFNDNLYRIEAVDDRSTLYLQLDIEALFAADATDFKKVFTTPSQVILHDFSFVVSQNTKIGEVIDSIKTVDSLVFDVELGEAPRELADGTRSVFLRVSYHYPERKLTEADVSPVRQKILTLLQDHYQAKVKA